MAKPFATEAVPHFLDFLPSLTAEEKSLLKGFCADSPASLWSTIQATPDHMARLLGPRRKEELARGLWQMLSADERKVLQAAPLVPPPPGAAAHRIGASGLAAPDHDVAKRDQLHQRLQTLLMQDSTTAKEEADSVRRELKSLLQDDAGNR